MPDTLPSRQRSHWLASFAIFTAIAIALQLFHQAYSSDLGADPDEPAHAVTALMLRDYLAHGVWHGISPMRFAKDYYDHFPKVALGHYPPGYYLVGGAALLLQPRISTLLILQALLAGACATATMFAAMRIGLSRATAFIAGAWFVTLPLTQLQTMLVMSDTQLSLGMLLSCLCFARYLETPTVKLSLGFGCLAAFTILTKASGAALALVPAIAIALRNDWRQLANWRLWLAPLPVALTAIPWTLATYHLTHEGMLDTPLAIYIREACTFYLQSLPDVISWPAIISVILALILVIKNRRQLSCTSATLLAFSLSLFLLYVVVRSGMDRRYLLPLVPPMIIAALWLVEQLCKGITSIAIAVVMVIAAHLTLSPAHVKDVRGFGEVAQMLVQKAPQGTTALISSDADGEGAFVAALAFALPDRMSGKWTVQRSSKLLAASDWVGRGYKQRFDDDAALLAGLREQRVEWLIHDRSIPSVYVLPHHEHIAAWVKAHAGKEAELVTTLPAHHAAAATTPELQLLRLAPQQTPPP